MTTKGRCPKCGAHLWLGPIADVNSAAKFDRSKRWNEFSTPRMNCRKCGAPLRYANESRFRAMYGMYFALLAAASGLAFWVWGPAGAAVTAVLLGAVGVPLLTSRAEYVLVTGHDS